MSRIEEALKKAQEGEDQPARGKSPAPSKSKRRRTKDEATRMGYLATVRTNLQFSLGDTERPCVLFCSSVPGEGVSTIVYYLSQLIAADRRTLLVDSNFLSPKLHTLFEMDNQKGLSDIYLKKASLDDCIQPTRVEGLDLLSAGPDASECYRFIGSSVAEKTFNDCRSRYEFILIDAPAVRISPDTVSLGAHCDGVVIVVRARKTKKQLIQYVQNQLANAGARELGVILNRMKHWVPGFIYRRL